MTQVETAFLKPVTEPIRNSCPSRCTESCKLVWLTRNRPWGAEFSSFSSDKLLAFGVFREAGEWTLKATVTEDNLANMNKVYDFILEQIEGLKGRQ